MPHTAGPWNTGGYGYKKDPDGRVHVFQSVWGPIPEGKQSGEWIAKEVTPDNARLIAAAPDLLDSLKELSNLRLFVEVYDGRAFDKSRILALLDKASAAIAKAEGR